MSGPEQRDAAVQKVALCSAATVTPDTPVRVVVDDTAYAVFNLDGHFYATQDECTHGPGRRPSALRLLLSA